jgi:hypothetical protein
VNLSLRNTAIVAIVGSSVRLATTTGADERSNSPSSPSARQRASHLLAVLGLIPSDSETAWTR